MTYTPTHEHGQTKNLNGYDILLAYPSERKCFFSPMPPLGLASIAAVAEEHGYTVKIVDFQYYNGDFRTDLLRWNPKIIGIGGTTPTRMESFRIARMSKEMLPEVPVVYGGPHATFTVDDTLNNISAIDFIVQGEGEYSFLKLCHKFAGRRDVDLATVRGLAFRSGDGITAIPPERINDLNALPMPARHLFEHEYSMSIDFLGLEADFLMTSRGCPVTCTFCSASRMFPGGVRLRSIDLVKKELDILLSRKPIKALKIFDSTFTADRNHVREFCEMIKPYGLFWECELRVDTVDFDLLQMMKHAGCFLVDIGMETSNEQLLKGIAKKISVAQVDNVLRWCRELDIKTKLFFIFGHLGETRRECSNDLAYIRKHRKEIRVFANSMGMHVYPGTSLEKKMKSSGMFPPGFSWARYRPSWKNYLLFEWGNVMIVEQKGLTIFDLLLVSIRLDLQMTNLSSEYIWRFVLSVIRAAYRAAARSIRNARRPTARTMYSKSHYQIEGKR